MTLCRVLRPILAALAWMPLAAGAVSRIDIRIGAIQHPFGVAEQVRATLDADGRWQGDARLREVRLPELAVQPGMPVKVTSGQGHGKVVFSGHDTGLDRLQADLAVRGLAFSDAEGLHAGEKIGGSVSFTLARAGQHWSWSGKVAWHEGEAFWQPLYLANGLSLEAGGTLSDDALAVSHGTITLAGVGKAKLSARLRRPGYAVEALDVAGEFQEFTAAYSPLVKPFLEKTMLGNLEVAGRADYSLSMRDGRLVAFDVTLRDFDVDDQNGRFALYKVNARVPWALNGETTASLRYAGGHLLKMPLGAADLSATLNGYALTAPELKLPVLDGVLTLHDVSAAFLRQEWHWHLGATLTPVSLADFSHAVGWPALDGKLAAGIPMVTYSNGHLRADGAMGFDVFGGSVVVRNLAMQNPLGLAPRLWADIEMRNLDLESLTRTYAFGAMTGRLDGDVKGLELSGWKPVKFDANFRSSPGNYPRKISQRAVENISALGGAGAAAAIQRSFLRFFKEFNYAKIGLSCKLSHGVCSMDGVEPAQSGYVIVKGSGIPAITVLGYNRTVSWDELLERVQRITAGNARPVFK